jgi:predicted NBD/HSP70 family sugar kinase
MARLATVSGIEELRRTNLRAMLHEVHVRGPITRAELTRTLGLSRSTIGGLTSDLAELGFVDERPPPAEGRQVQTGRPSHIVLPRLENAVIAIDVGVDRLQVALVGLGGAVLERRVRSHRRGAHDVHHVVEKAATMAEEILRVAGPVRLLGAAASVPAAVRTSDGMVHFAPNLGWHAEPFSELMSQRLGRPVRTGNEANLGMMAEHLRGAAVGYDHAVYLSANIGIGGGFLVGGRLLEGAVGYAGEVGHIQVDPAGPKCRCGSSGCWELKIGENRLLALAGRSVGGGPKAVAEVIAAASEGDPQALAAVDEVTDWISVGLRSIINLFNPQVIVIGGTMSQLWGGLGQKVETVLDGRALFLPRSDVALVISKLGPDSSLIGAAELAFAAVLDDPTCVLSATTT